MGTIRQAVIGFSKARGSQTAGSLAFFALFSLLPLTLLLVSVAGYLAESEQIFVTVARLVEEIFPAGHDVLIRTLAEIRVMQIRGAAGVLGLVGAIWATSGWFHVLAYNINIAWPNLVLRSPVHSRLFSLGMVAILLLLLLLSLLATIVGEVLPALSLPFRLRFAVLFSDLWRLVLSVLPWVLTFLMFLGIYRWVPNKRVRWRAALIGAASATIAWELAKILFAWYLSSRLSNFSQVYGSLATMVVAMTWIYLSGLIALMGAHLTAAFDRRGSSTF
ncbi:MAG TPA: YihY/virulence factor BrkB family protein [Anaerolineaceae bacterium]|nr:YihY/virulence factor BrkB family protein [Anaerolineaceae bacterium]